MNCAEVLTRLSAWTDGELDEPEARVVEVHVAECEGCRAVADGLRDVDLRLSAALAVPREVLQAVEDEVLACVSESSPIASSPTPVDPPQGSSSRGGGVGALLLATAAGFLVAVLVFRPWEVRERVEYVERLVPRPAVPSGPDGTDQPMDVGVARFVVATGPVSVREQPGGDWSPVSDIATFTCPTDAEVRTESGTRAELQTVDGCTILLNDETELLLENGRSVALGRGEILCMAPDQVALEVRAREKAEAGPPAWVWGSCEQGSCMWSEKGNEGVRVTAAMGNVAVQTDDGERKVKFGESVVVRDGKVVRERDYVCPLLATRWVHPLLVEKGAGSADLDARVDAYLALVGFSKMSHLYESEIRSLGENAALPLLRFVQSPSSHEVARRRQRAVSILADIAPVRTVGDLIGLLDDDDPVVRTNAARGLQRLTGETMGRAPSAWRESREACAPTRAAWSSWWETNRSRFPTSDTARRPVDASRGGEEVTPAG